MKRMYAAVLLSLAGLMTVTGCGAARKSDASSAEKNPVSLQMAWTHEYSGAGLYAAEKNGHFAEQGLDVTLVEGGFGENGYIEPIDVVVDGTYDFGLSDAETLIRARANGKPVVAIATIMQRSPTAILSLPSNHIQRPQDMVDHTVQVAAGGALNLYNALLKAQNIAPDAINLQPRTDFGISPLLSGETDALMGWIINEGVQVQEAGATPDVILLSDYGIDTYNLVLFTTDTTLQEKPELVERFLHAVLLGYQDVIADPAQAVTYIHDYNAELDSAGQQRRLEAMIPLMNIPGLNLGSMDSQIWQDTHDFMVDSGAINVDFDVQSVYTTTFLDKIYGNQGR